MMIDEALADLRNKIFKSRRFQEGAASLPLVRRIAHRRAARLFDLTAGFVYSQVLYALVDLDLFRRLESGPAALADLAREAGLSESAMERLVKAAAALSLLSLRRGGRVALGPQGAALLGNPSVFDMVRHHRILFEDLADPVGMLRAPKGSTRLAAYWGYAGERDAGALPAERVGDYSALMAATQGFIADEILSAYDFRRHHAVLDVGGGTGAFLTAVARAAPKARLMLFDLPAVAEQARARFAEAGLSDRADAHGGNFKTGALPEGADLITMVRILHDHDDDVVTRLLALAFDALPAGGRLLVAEPMAGTKGADAMGDAYFGLYLWAMGSGAPRTEATLRSMIGAAGFRRVRPVKTRRPMLTRLIIAEKPSSDR